MGRQRTEFSLQPPRDAQGSKHPSYTAREPDCCEPGNAEGDSLTAIGPNSIS